MRINLDRLHNTHFAPIRKNSDQTIYVLAEIIGYLQLLKHTTINVVLENNNNINYVAELFEGWIGHNKPGPEFMLEKPLSFLYEFTITGNRVLFMTRLDYEANNSWEGEYVIFDESANWLS